MVWRRQWPIIKRCLSVYYLEERANSESDNPQVQAKYLEVGYHNFAALVLVLCIIIKCIWDLTYISYQAGLTDF